MTKQIQVPDGVYNALCAIAESRGRSIKPGRGSGMVATLREMAEMFQPIECGEIRTANAELAGLRAKTARMCALLRRTLQGPIYHDDALTEDIEAELDGERLVAEPALKRQSERPPAAVR